MAFEKNSAIIVIVLCFQVLNSALAKPAGFGGGCGCDGFGGGFPVGGEFGAGGFGSGPISPPISFLPVPQPVPIRVPQPPRQSVTIPNIILALLPPNQKPPCAAPRPITRPPPPPVVLPLPQPYPCAIPERCGC